MRLAFIGGNTRQSPLLIGPDSIEVGRDKLRVGDGWCRTFAVTGYPREVRPGWLDPILSAPGRVDIALCIDPIPQALAADRMRRQRARLESSRRSDDSRGQLTDPDIEVAAADAQDLAERIARGDGRLFRVGLYVTVHAESEHELDAESARVRGLLGSLLLDAKPATFRALQGWMTTLPLGVDRLQMTRTFDTDALAAAFPFSAAELDCTSGVFYGLNTSTGGVVTWDRFAQPNHNAVILARSGAGKSYLAKLEALRSLYSGVEVAIVDPENEYTRLADAVGGVVLRLGAGDVRLNPFDLGTEPDAFTRRAIFLHTFVHVLLGVSLGAESRSALDRAIVGAYAARGITADPQTHARPVPLLADLVAAMHRDQAPAAVGLASQLEPFVTGTHRHLFDGPTTTRPDGHLVVFSLRDLADEVRPVAMLLVLDALWRRISNQRERRRRMVLVDEAWLVMRDEEGAKFLFRLAKSARKYWCGLTVVTQDAADLLGSDLGQAVVANATTQVLLGQAPQAIDAIGTAFRLSDGEKTFLLSARQGEGILVGGNDRVAFRAMASPAEHRLATSNPAELIADELTASDDDV